MTGAVTAPEDAAAMPRSNEVVRQWQVLRALAAARFGLTIESLAAEQGVTSRTIRRDLAALQRAGFPLGHDSDELPLRWRVHQTSLGQLASGFTLLELCALHFGKATAEALGNSPLGDEFAQAMSRIEGALPPAMRQFLDAIPSAVAAKAAPGAKRLSARDRQRLTQLLDAAVQRRTVRMRYRSAASDRVKDYEVEPQRIVTADGGMYLTGFVQEYGGTRTFSLERIINVTTSDRRCVVPANVGPAFANSFGVFEGQPETIVLEFAADAADYVSARQWHSSQVITPLESGRLLLKLRVCVDVSLRRWVLGFGGDVRVVAPARLATDVADSIGRARRHYAPRLKAIPHEPMQRRLPFAEPPLWQLLGEKAS
jgi:proteasome accessory factor C